MISSQFAMSFVPGQFYDSVDGVQKPCVIKQCSGTLAVGANQQIIALVSLKKLLIISGWVCAHTATASDFFFLSNGTQITGNLRSPAQDQIFFDPNSLGYVESTVSQNLALTVATAGLQYFFRYIEFSPTA